MICPDCEFETDKLTSQGRCKKCSTRFNQLNYMNKRDGTNKPYIPLKELVGTKEYNRVIAKRGVTPKKATKQTKQIIIKEDLRTKYYGKVSADLNKEFEKNKISKAYLEVDLPNWMETFWLLLQEDSVVLDAVKAGKVFDDLSYLYLHNQLNISWDNENKMLENSLYEKAVLELRRPTKDFIIYWKVISDVINAIKNDSTLMETIRCARNDLKLKAQALRENPVYNTEIDNELSTGNNIKVVEKNYKYYNIKVTVKGLYGHNYTETFKLDTPMYARGEDEAKRRFIEFMNEKFPGVKYKEDNIKVEEIK